MWQSLCIPISTWGKQHSPSTKQKKQESEDASWLTFLDHVALCTASAVAHFATDSPASCGRPAEQFSKSTAPHIGTACASRLLSSDAAGHAAPELPDIPAVSNDRNFPRGPAPPHADPASHHPGNCGQTA